MDFSAKEFGIRSAHTSTRTVVVRGDLYSDTGYARATRALSQILRTQCDRLFGISIHEHASRRTNEFDFPVISTADLKNSLAGAIVINICIPDEFLHNTSTFNVGYFFWETEQLPVDRSWKAHMFLMDALWAPSTWQSNFIGQLTGRASVPVIPWPQIEAMPISRSRANIRDSIRCHQAMSPSELNNFLIRCTPPGLKEAEKRREEEQYRSGIDNRFNPGTSPTLAQVLLREGDSFLAIQTDAPRKGLPLLLTGWLLFKQRSAGRHAKLIIKLSALDTEADFFRIHFHSSLAVRRAAQRIGVTDPDVWFVYGQLDSEEQDTLLSSCDALVSATMGEGFGGPLAEALMHGIPVVAPTHTACRDIFGNEYPLAVDAEPNVLSLWHNIGVYSPSSVWYVIDDQSFVEALCRFSYMSPLERKDLAVTAKKRLMAHAGVDAVTSSVATALHALSE